MLTSDYDKYICEKYITKEMNRKPSCNNCPLMIDIKHAMCKGNSHYDKQRKEWVFDDE